MFQATEHAIQQLSVSIRRYLVMCEWQLLRDTPEVQRTPAQRVKFEQLTKFLWPDKHD